MHHVSAEAIWSLCFQISREIIAIALGYATGLVVPMRKLKKEPTCLIFTEEKEKSGDHRITFKN
jgi:hypothetical protein